MLVRVALATEQCELRSRFYTGSHVMKLILCFEQAEEVLTLHNV